MERYKRLFTEDRELTSRFDFGDRVIFTPMERDMERLSINAENSFGTIVNIKFTQAKVFYDIIDDYYGELFKDVTSDKVEPFGGVTDD